MATVPFDKLGGKLWYNGELVDWDAGRLHILSHGLHYGSCVFEGERAYGGRDISSTRSTRTGCLSRRRSSGMEIPYSQQRIVRRGL